MNCFPCFSSQKGKNQSSSKKDQDYSFHPQQHPQPTADETVTKEAPTVTPADYESAGSVKAFNFRELLSATKNFRQEFLLGEGSFGKVYKGNLQGKDVAVKQLDRNAMEENNEFFVEVGQLSLLQHPNLVSLVGYCNDGDQRLLVYEFMSGGSLEDRLHGTKSEEEPLDWVTRMKIAYGAAEGLQYLHEKAKPAIVYRDLMSSKILLDDQLNPKLSNVGLEKLGSSTESKMPMQSRMMDNHGYNAPEYTNSGTVSTMTDVYSFGVVLLELITGRKPLDGSRPQDEQSLVAWAQPLFKEPKHFPQMADPLLESRFPERGLNQVVAIAAMCVQEEATARPMISDLGAALSFLSIAKEENLPPSLSSKLHSISDKLVHLEGTPDAKDEDQDESGDEEEEEEEEGSTSGSSDEETHQPNINDNGDGNESHNSLSHKSSGRSMFSINNDSGRREANSMSHKESNKSASVSSGDDEATKSKSNKSASHSSGDDEATKSKSNKSASHSSGDDEATKSKSNKSASHSSGDDEATKSKSNKSASHSSGDDEATKLKSNKSASYSSGDDEATKLTAASSSGDLSDAAADATAALSNENTDRKSGDDHESGNDMSQKGSNDSLEIKPSKKEKGKNRKSSKKKKSKDGSSKSGGKRSNDEASTKKSRHKTKKRSNKDDDLAGESQPEN